MGFKEGPKFTFTSSSIKASLEVFGQRKGLHNFSFLWSLCYAFWAESLSSRVYCLIIKFLSFQRSLEGNGEGFPHIQHTSSSAVPTNSSSEDDSSLVCLFPGDIEGTE